MIGVIIKKILAYLLSLFLTLSSIVGARLSPPPTDGNEVTSDKLHTAIYTDNEQAFIEAVNEGADINELQTSQGGTVSPLVFSVRSENPRRMTEKILEYDIDPDFVDLKGSTVFCETIEYSYIFNKLLSLNPDLNYIDRLGLSAIDYAVSARDTHILSTLLDKGADVTEKNIKRVIDFTKGRYAKYPVISVHDIVNHPIVDVGDIVYYTKVLNLLLNNYNGDGIDKNLYMAYTGNFSSDNKCKNDWVLYGIAGYCSKEILAKYIDDKSDLALLFRIAASADNIENMQYLADLGADLRFNSERCYFNALRYSVEYDNIEATKYILTLNQEDVDECVRIATNNDNMAMVKLLYESKPNNKNTDAFEAAMSGYHTEILKYFVDNGFDVNAYDSAEISPYIAKACRYCDLDTVKFMQQHGGIINDDNILDAVKEAMFTGNTEVLRYLIDMGADVDGLYKYEDPPVIEHSPIFTAVRDGFYDIVQLLVENGATAKCLSAEYYPSFLDHAKDSKDIYEYLNAKGIITE